MSALIGPAAEVATPAPVFDVEDETFLGPGDMVSRIERWFVERGQQPPVSRSALPRPILQSLADAYARAIDTARQLSSAAISVVHMLGGGSQNALLCQHTADSTGLPVLAGPVEATAIGNALVLASAQGLVGGDLEALRALVTAAGRSTAVQRAAAAANR